MTELSIGVISEGTTRSVDVLPALAETLADVDTVGEYAGLVEDAKRTAITIESEEDSASRQRMGDLCEYASELGERLRDALAEYAPPYCYVGTHEGDSADIGVWPDIARVQECVSDGEVAPISAEGDWDLSGNDPDACPDPNTYDAVYSVNDHGNATLYVPDESGNGWREAWSVV